MFSKKRNEEILFLKYKMFLLYLLLHLHIFEDGMHPPGLGKHGSKSCGVSNNENPCPYLSEQQENTQLCHGLN